MKRASRHFGDKLGNSLYDSRFKASMAPTTLRQALDLHDLEYNKRTFFDRDRAGGGTGTNVEGATMGGAAAAAPPGAALPSGMMNFIAVSYFMGLASYVNTFVAQYTGAGRDDRVGHAVWQGNYLSLVAGCVGVRGKVSQAPVS